MNYTFPEALKADYGTPQGHCEETSPGSGKFRREYSKATVELEEVRPAGTWQAFGRTLQQPLLVVSVSYLVTVERKRKLRGPDTRHAAAAKIQAVYRGSMVRIDFGRNARAADARPRGARSDDYLMAFHRKQRMVVERERAAIKIQAAHRGKAARKEVEAMREEQEAEEPPPLDKEDSLGAI